MPALSQHSTLLRLLALVLAAALVGGCSELAEPPAPDRPGAPAAAPDDQTWLVMLYQDADDEILEEDMVNDLNEAELVGSTDRVQVVAQMDRYDGSYDGDGDWTSTKRFLVEQDDDLLQIKSRELADLGEVNMADANTLIDFVTWAAETYPADKYVLIMSDHGAGWPGGWNDPDPPTEGRHDIALAKSFGDMLFLMELDEALGEIRNRTSIGQFELIGFDACLMGSIEVYNAVAPHARYAVASQEVEPSLGWAYAAFLGRLADSPEIDGAELAQAIVDSYIEQDQQVVDDEARARYVERVYEHGDNTSAAELIEEEIKSVTLNSVDLAAIPALNASLDQLVRVIAAGQQKPVAAARRYAQAFETVFDDEQPDPYIDLGSFAQLLKQKLDDPAVDAAADELLAAIDRAVIDEKHGEERAGATGVSIHFPNSKLYQDADAGAESYTLVAAAFAEQSLWDEFLAFHYTKQPLPEGDAPPSAALEEAAEPPGAAPIEVAPVTLSAPTLTRDEPVLIQSSVSGDNIAFVYLFIGRVDGRNGDIKIVDIDFLDAEEIREVEGVYYPDWNDTGEIELEFEWDGRVFAIDNGESSATALLYPEDYGASSEQATYSVEGSYVTAKGKKERRALLLFSDGQLIQAFGYTGTDGAGALREITPKPGDRFTIEESWLSDDDGEFFVKAGKTLVFGEENFFWNDVTATKGEYLVGFIAEDLDGNWYPSYETVTLE